MFTPYNRALSTMVPCKLKKQVVRQHLKSNSESNSSSDKVFVDKEAKSNGKNSPIESLLDRSVIAIPLGKNTFGSDYSLVQKMPDNEVAGAVWDGDNDKLATKMRIKQIYCLKT